MKRSAIISPCGRYRYELKRRWLKQGPTALFIMLNPSTADALQDDPTIRRCIGFARREGCSALRVVNLMAYRATDPDNLPDNILEAVGPDNDRHLAHAIERVQGPIIAAWGGNRRALEPRDLLFEMLDLKQVRLHCLGKTSKGAPKHPLYLPNNAPLIEYP